MYVSHMHGLHIILKYSVFKMGKYVVFTPSLFEAFTLVGSNIDQINVDLRT